MNLTQRAECPLKILSCSPEETFCFGKRIGSFLSCGSVVSLEGELGSGKTCLAKGIGAALGIKENITSPTYTIINEYSAYENDLTFFHIDAYRLNSEKEFEDIGGDEIINSGSICLIEWAGNIKKSLPQSAIAISINITGSESREITVTGLDAL